MPSFIPGLDLAERFFRDAVRPALGRCFPGLAYSAGRLDFGSDVLGFDTPQSMDHDWGPKCTLFLSETDAESLHSRIVESLAWELPLEVAGFATHFSQNANGTRNNEPAAGRPISHWVTVTTPRRFFSDYLGVDPTQPVRDVDWLTIPQQRLRTVACGKVFHDGLGVLEPARQRLRWYPRDVWLYLLSNQWQRISQEEPFMARCGDVGDELGSRLVAARLVRELMRLCFLMEQQYTPYIKWLGTAFARLGCANALSPLFIGMLDAQNWRTREQPLSAAYVAVMQLHNALGLTPPQEAGVWSYYSRPYLVPHSGRFVEALQAAIQSPEVRGWPPDVGSVDQFVDSTDILESPVRSRKLAVIYTE